MQAQNFMRVEEVAQELGISKSHAYKVIHILVAFSEFPVPMPVYVCISFVTYEHPLYRFIVLPYTGGVLSIVRFYWFGSLCRGIFIWAEK